MVQPITWRSDAVTQILFAGSCSSSNSHAQAEDSTRSARHAIYGFRRRKVISEVKLRRPDPSNPNRVQPSQACKLNEERPAA